jgi:biopolymer transport protein ExbB/biopolymer transport protein TolQ
MNLVESLLKVALLGSEWVMYLLLVLSVASFAAMFERWLYMRKHGRTGGPLRGQLTAALSRDDIGEVERVLAADRSVSARVIAAALPFRAGGAQAVADAADSELTRIRPELERGLNLLGTLGNNAPFIGLFGTVIGVIQAFDRLGGQGNKAAAMGNVMAGISEALVATGVGIFVAIPAVVAFNNAQKRIGEIEGDAQSLVKLVTAFVKAKENPAFVGPTGTAALGAARAGGRKAAESDSSIDLGNAREAAAHAGGE